MKKRLAESAIEAIIHISASLAIVGLVLIFVFIGKEALPVLLSKEVRQEAGLSRLFLPQSPEPGEPREFAWQPVSEIPKYSLLPLMAGTIKVTFVALFFALPLALGRPYSVPNSPLRGCARSSNPPSNSWPESHPWSWVSSLSW